MQDYTTHLNELLFDAHITRAELARVFDINPRNISRWNKHGIPQYAIAYLKLRSEFINLQKTIKTH